jgi:glycosyltransferase involved in cell wall biosynthesis
VSHFASDYFAQLGFRKENIYPFGYFRAIPTSETDWSIDTVNLVYVGQFIHRKGVDILLESLTALWTSFPRVRLSLIGDGPERAFIEAKIQAKGLADRVTLEGSRPSSGIHEVLARASALILPSRWDGWGLVINEALSAGVPVIASDRCGAADLILHGVNGYIFRSEDSGSLQTCLRALLNSHGEQMRTAALRTGSALTIPVVSDYFIACLEHMCGLRSNMPTPPWEGVLRRLESESNASQRIDHASRADMTMESEKSA